MTSVFHRCTRTEAHGAIVFNGVVAVAATVVAVLAGFLAAHERATLKRGRCAYCVGERAAFAWVMLSTTPPPMESVTVSVPLLVMV